MASFIKSKLKAARDAISKKDYATASDAASQVLSYEASNYNAMVFLGLSCLELGDIETSEKAYLDAIAASAEQPLAWQGLSKLYERVGKWEKYAETLSKLVDLFAKADDASRCAENVQKLIELRRERGTRPELISALGLLLPNSPVYTVLSSLPPPEPTAPTAHSAHAIQLLMQNSLPLLEEIVALTEREQEETIKKEIDKRRMRIDAGSQDDIRKAVTKLVIGSSKLSDLYEEILNHPHTSDTLRRTIEGKLLRHKSQQLSMLSAKGDDASQKDELRDEVYRMAKGAVLLDIPDELAWSIFVEWKDVEYIEEYDYQFLRRYRSVFPTSPFSKVALGYFRYMQIPLSEEETDGDDEPGLETGDEDDPLDVLTEGLEHLPNSLVAYRMLTEIQRLEQDWENLIKTCEQGLHLVRAHELETGQKLASVTKAFNVELSIALVHLHPPKNHIRALRILDSVLAQDPNHISCLLGRGYVLESAQKWGEAAILFTKVLQQGKGGVHELEAKEERAWCWIQNEQGEKGEEALREVIPLWDQQRGCETQQARAWWRLGRCLWDQKSNDRRDEAHKSYITSLKRSPTFAPSFTALGIYYLEAASPPDPSRASKCFQKAFELDSREGEAARRLADGFADEGEWDLVEVVARRTIEGEGGLDATKPGTSGRHLPTNAWAWKAIGAVELNKRDFSTSIQAFQIALRAEPEDYNCWLRLGEAYARSGRYVAAIKALTRAQELNPANWGCSYLMADVQCQIGQFDAAISIFSDLLSSKGQDPGVLLSLADAHLAYGRMQKQSGFLFRSEASFRESVENSLLVLSGDSAFRRLGWKTLSDALYELSAFPSFDDAESVFTALAQVDQLLGVHKVSKSSILENISSITNDLASQGVADSIMALKLCLLTNEHRVGLAKFDDVGSSSAWFDLALGVRGLSTKLTGEEAEQCSRTALRCMKEAVRADPSDPAHWNALGVLCLTSNAKLSQHAFLAALEIDAKDPLLWTNLGMLYLHYQDAELANQAFLRAQTLDPDQPLAWVGQALVAVHNGHGLDADALFEHAVIISSGSMLEASHVFATRLFAAPEAKRSQIRTERLFLAFSALDRYCRERTDDATVLHLHGLICEQLGQDALAEQRLYEAIALLESQYEMSEDVKIERRYAIAHANLGRVLLRTTKYNEALHSFDIVLSILPGETEEEEVAVLRAQAGLGSGLAYFMLEDLAPALSCLETAAEQVPKAQLEVRGHITLLLAKTLWALGSGEGRETAKTMLLECISADPHNLAAITTLASIGSLGGDEDLLQAALAEIHSMDREHRRQIDPSGEVEYLLEMHHLLQGDVAGAMKVAEEAVHADPFSSSAKRQLTRLLLSSGDSAAAKALMQAELPDKQDHPDDSLRLSALVDLAADGEDGAGRSRGLATEAVMIAPWNAENWATLVVTTSSRTSTS